MKIRLTDVGPWLLFAIAIAAVTDLAKAEQPAPQTQPSEPPSAGENGAPAPDLAPDDRARLQRIRQIIENTKDSMGTRRVQAEELLKTGWPAATDVAAELLSNSAHPSTRVAVCEAITTVGTKDPKLLGERHSALIEPLLLLLGNPEPAVSDKAGTALAAFPNGNVTERLGHLAADTNATTQLRLAAVDALALNVYHRHTVRQLIGLLDENDKPLQDRVLGALRAASWDDHGNDVQQWLAWWQREEETLSDEEWVANRAKLYYVRLAEAHRDLQHLQSTYQQEYAALARRVTDSMRELYRLIAQPAKKEEALLRWLADPLVEYRLGAATLIRDQLQDGHLPADDVVNALLARLNDQSPEMRRAVLGIVGALNVPDHADPVLTLLKDERDVLARQTALRVLGQLRNPAAVATLTAELADSTRPPDCAAEAASALGILGAKGRIDAPIIAPAIPVLKARFAATPPHDARLRETLLRAMATIGAPEFRDEFLLGLASDKPALIIGAIQGLATLGDTTALDRLVTLAGHADARVRQTAIEALGTLGGEPAHLEALAGRLTATAEPAEPVRNAAWKALRAILGRKGPAERLQWVERLTETPDRQTTYLDELIKEFAALSPPPPELNEARSKLAALHSQRGNFDAAITIGQQLHAALVAANDPTATDVALALLSSALAGARSDVAKDTLLGLAKSPAETKQEAIGKIKGHIESHKSAEHTEQTLALIDTLLSLEENAYGKEFGVYLLDVKKQLAPPPPPPTTAPTE